MQFQHRPLLIQWTFFTFFFSVRVWVNVDACWFVSFLISQNIILSKNTKRDKSRQHLRLKHHSLFQMLLIVVAHKFHAKNHCLHHCKIQFDFFIYFGNLSCESYFETFWIFGVSPYFSFMNVTVFIIFTITVTNNVFWIGHIDIWVRMIHKFINFMFSKKFMRIHYNKTNMTKY